MFSKSETIMRDLMKNQIKAFIFDLEGVLVLHKKRQSAVIEKAFENNGIKLKFRIESIYFLWRQQYCVV